MNHLAWLVLCLSALETWCGAAVNAASDAPLPAGVKAVWDTEKAFREWTPSRERI